MFNKLNRKEDSTKETQQTEAYGVLLDNLAKSDNPIFADNQEDIENSAR
jgi:hypothetical protein